MVNYAELLINTIHDYNINKINRTELNQWAINLLNTMLNSRDIMYIDAFRVYPFISNLSINEEWEFPCDDEINEYIEVLQGNKNMKYSCYFKIPQDIVMHSIDNIENLLKCYIKKGQMMEDDLEILDYLMIENETIKIDTITDILFSNTISTLLQIPIKNDWDVNANTLFMDSNELDIKDIINRLSKIIDCYKGNKSFLVNIVYKNGNYMISVMI